MRNCVITPWFDRLIALTLERGYVGCVERVGRVAADFVAGCTTAREMLRKRTGLC